MSSLNGKGSKFLLTQLKEKVLHKDNIIVFLKSLGMCMCRIEVQVNYPSFPHQLRLFGTNGRSVVN
jgi:hypothetical protein